VAQLDEIVGEALERIRGMSLVTERLERREAERLPVKGFAELHVDGTTYSAELSDLSIGGARLFADRPIAVTTGGVVRLHLPLGPDSVTVTASVVRDRPEGEKQELGVRFIDVEPAVALKLEEFLSSATTWVEEQPR
jgi:c-di-GMP-binding flagellar brake protein YcgR